MARTFCLSLALALLALGRCGAQTDSGYQLVLTIQADIVDFRVDKLGNIYLLSSNDQLKKVGPHGDSMAVFNEVQKYGKLYSLDVTNPLKILLYYKEFSTIVIVDRFLNIMNTIDLRSLNIFQAKAIALAYDNNVWVFDELEAKLKRIGDDGSLIDQTTDFRQILDSVPDPTLVADQSGIVYLYDPEMGVYSFDHYGAFRRYIHLTGWEDFSVVERNLLGRDHQNLLRFPIDSFSIKIEPIPKDFLPAVRITIMPGMLYVLKANELSVYAKR